MSLDSDFKLAQDFGFKGRVVIAISKMALDIIRDGASSDSHRKFAKDVLRRIDYFAERFYVTVAATEGVDTSSIDTAIEAAVRNLILTLAD